MTLFVGRTDFFRLRHRDFVKLNLTSHKHIDVRRRNWYFLLNQAQHKYCKEYPNLVRKWNEKTVKTDKIQADFILFWVWMCACEGNIVWQHCSPAHHQRNFETCFDCELRCQACIFYSWNTLMLAFQSSWHFNLLSGLGRKRTQVKCLNLILLIRPKTIDKTYNLGGKCE